MAFDKKVIEDAMTAFIRARIKLLSSHPFYAHLVMKLELKWAEDVGGGLSATDGTSIIINPEAFLKLSSEERITDLVHEVLHCAAGHLFRRGSRNPEKWNLAADIYIDNLMEAERFAAGPWEVGREQGLRQMGLSKAQFRDQVTEVIYEALPDTGGGSGASGKGKGGKCPFHGPNGSKGCFSEKQDSAERSSAEATWKQNVIEAGLRAQMAGNAAGKWSELVKAAMPKPPFTLKLHEYLSRGLGGDSDWGCLNRRWLHLGLYLPTDTKVTMGRVATFIDTSGSMSSEQLQLALGYIRAFREQHPCVLDMVQCDHDCVEDAQYHCYDEWERLPETFEVHGRGGTSFDPPFKLLREKKIQPKVAIYLTDAYGECTEKNPGYPVLWVVLKGAKDWQPPFGEKVVVE